MQNPFRTALEKSGLAQHKFALLLGVNAMTLYKALDGESKRPASLIRGMQALGYDPAATLEKYQIWRINHRAQMLAVANGQNPAEQIIQSKPARSRKDDDQGEKSILAGPGPGPAPYRGVW